MYHTQSFTRSINFAVLVLLGAIIINPPVPADAAETATPAAPLDLKSLAPTAEVKPSESKVEAMMDSKEEHVAKHGDPLYVCPMHPQIQQGEPGNCPICGMDLVLKEVKSGASAAENDGPPSVSVSASTAQSMGIRIGKVQRTDLRNTINTLGNVQYNEDSLYHVHARGSGWLNEIKVRSLGEPVEEGKLLLGYYSPDVNNTQQEFIYAPSSGFITQLDVRAGMYITPSTVLYTIADLSSVWVIADVFADQVSRLETGRTAIMAIDSLPGREWKGVVDYIYPELNAKTRSLRVRLAFENADHSLKPNMFANVKIYTQPKDGVLAVPREALIPAAGGYRVVKVVNDREYQPVKVKIGIRTDDQVEILEGLQAGDEIVLSGQFMLDSESNLQASFRRMTP